MDIAAVIALLSARGADRPWSRDLFSEQRRVVRSRAKRKAILCGRRSGKTVAAAAALADGLEDAGFDEAVVYAARTRIIAKRLIWAKLHKIAHDSGAKWKFSESDLTIYNERQGFLMIVGLDKPAEIEKLRGIKLRRFVGDEPATYTHVLDALYEEILEPAAADLDGDIYLVGTPGPILHGFWYRASTAQPGYDDWERHHWTMMSNPHMPGARAYLDRVLRRKGLSEAAPIIQQEYYGVWCPDDAAQVYRYSPAVNDHDGLPPDYRPDKWVHTIAVDFGVVDDFSWSVLASHPHQQIAYVVDSGAASGWVVGQMADTVLRLVNAYNVHKLVGDPGGGGKALIVEWHKRYLARAGGVVMEAAAKTDKRAAIDVINDSLRTSKLLLCQPGCAALGQELMLLPWHDSNRMKEHPSYPNNRADSLLYAHRHHTAYWHDAPASPTPTEPPDHPAQIARETLDLARESGDGWWDRS